MTALMLMVALAAPASHKAWCDGLTQKVLAEITRVETLEPYVTGVGQRLLAARWRPSGPFVFYVYQSGEPNAFALCGGRVFVSTALLALVEDEHELAGVLAHEIVHNTERHVVRMHRKQRVLKDVVGTTGGPVAILPLLVGTLGMLHASREYEEDADEDGVKLAMLAGYDGRGLLRFLARVESNAGLRILRSHPELRHRQHKITVDLRKMEFLGFRPARDATPKEFVAMKAALKAS